ncbi:Alpha/Beta hydrolase protein [Chytriomyces sp. MP71]|nr:Alpha/Beta hydrolase protein [Chytriomyces sp. MP71]
MDPHEYTSRFTRLATEDGCHVAYRIISAHFSNPPLLLVMGWSGISLDWDHFAEALAVARPVILIDNRGMGASAFPRSLSSKLAETVSLERMAKDVLAVIVHVNCRMFDLLGLSMGGMVAQTLERLLRNGFGQGRNVHLRKLILMSTSARGLSAEDTGLTLDVVMPRPDDTSLDITKRIMEVNLAPGFRTAYPDTFERICGISASGIRPMDVVMAQSKTIGRKLNMVDQLPLIRVPTLVIHGTEDRVISIQRGDELARLIPGCHYVEGTKERVSNYLRIEGGGHLIFEDGSGGRSIVSRINQFLDSATFMPETSKL